MMSEPEAGNIFFVHFKSGFKMEHAHESLSIENFLFTLSSFKVFTYTSRIIFRSSYI